MRIYTVADRRGSIVRWVRANNLNAAIRAVAHETWVAKAATTDQVFTAMKAGASILEAVDKQVDIEDVIEVPANGTTDCKGTDDLIEPPSDLEVALRQSLGEMKFGSSAVEREEIPF